MMRSAVLLAALAAAVLAAAGSVGAKKHVMCYYGSWAVYRPGNGKFDVENIDPYICTHHIYTFAGLSSNNTIESLDPWTDLFDNYGKGGYIRFTNMKKKNPELKTILAIGGWSDGSAKYSNMAKTASTRETFANSVVAFLQKYNFDGLDLDWEFPAQRGGEPIDKVDYIKLIKLLRAKFDPHRLILTAAVGADISTIDDSYRLKGLGKYLDIVNVMAYDYHGSWDPFTGHVAPLYLSPQDLEPGHEDYAHSSVNDTINYFINGGIPREKIAMGIPLYGRGFLLNDPSVHGLYAPANQPQPACPFTREAGACGFNEICILLNEGGWTSVRDPDQMCVYSFKGRNWIGYDDLESARLKTDYIKDMNLGGSMVWSIEADDFHNLCGYGTANPMLTAIWTNLNGDVPYPNGTTIPRTPPQPIVAPDHVCKKSGLNPNPDKTCSPTYYSCVMVGDHWDVNKEECAPGTVFDRAANTCTWKNESAECRHTLKA